VYGSLKRFPEKALISTIVLKLGGDSWEYTITVQTGVRIFLKLKRNVKAME
jgi:hypothetical protein